MKIENMPIASIKPFPNNPRNITERAIALVTESIKEFGFNVPIIIDVNNTIVAGHTRYLSAQRLGLKEVPAIKIIGLTKEKIKAFRIMDNRTQEMSSWDYVKLEKEFGELLELNVNLDLTGFDEDVRDILLFEEGDIQRVEKSEVMGNLIEQKDYIIITFSSKEEGEAFRGRFNTPKKKSLSCKEFLESYAEQTNSNN